MRISKVSKNIPDLQSMDFFMTVTSFSYRGVRPTDIGVQFYNPHLL